MFVSRAAYRIAVKRISIRASAACTAGGAAVAEATAVFTSSPGAGTDAGHRLARPGLSNLGHEISVSMGNPTGSGTARKGALASRGGVFTGRDRHQDRLCARLGRGADVAHGDRISCRSEVR